MTQRAGALLGQQLQAELQRLDLARHVVEVDGARGLLLKHHALYSYLEVLLAEQSPIFSLVRLLLHSINAYFLPSRVFLALNNF
mmetsp:Transcript_25719/g.34357  ORF Transcript_25719/g.34357 Transcript_25719/m.34357 type:complete len:84 (-) Transcript_25719:616-867(-)